MKLASLDLRDQLADLPPGGRAVVVFTDSAHQARFVERCMYRGKGVFGLVSAGTTLLDSLSMKDNLRLPIYYHGRSTSHLEEDLATLCRVARIEARSLLHKPAGAATRVERIQGSFLQAALLRPEVMLCDGIFEGLGASERTSVAGLVDAFHCVFPLRCSAYLGVTAPPEGLYPHGTWIDA